jgi:hypothetical protein
MADMGKVIGNASGKEPAMPQLGIVTHIGVLPAAVA